MAESKLGRIIRNRGMLQAAVNLLDTEWYIRRYKDVGAREGAAKRHYLTKGIGENRSPSPFFDAEWYIDMNGDVAEAGLPAIFHYLKSGGREGRSPSPFIDHDAYMSKWGDAVILTKFGTVFEDLTASPDRADQFPFLHPDFYLDQLSIQDERSSNLARHFLMDGLANGLSPHPLIEVSTLGLLGDCAEDYAKFADLFRTDCRNTEIATHPLTDPVFFKRRHGENGRHPIANYLSGWDHEDGSWINPLFDVIYYQRANPKFDPNAGIDPFAHFLLHGEKDGVWPNHYFDTNTYRERFGHLLNDGTHPIVHYLENGTEDWAEPSKRFGQKYCLTRDRVAKEVGEAALVRFLHADDPSLSPLPPKPFLDQTTGLSDDDVVARIRAHAEDRLASSNPTVSVIIPVYCNLRYTLRCVLSCLQSNDDVDFEIIIADDVSPDGSGQYLAENLANIDGLAVVINETNLGFLKSCNAAAADAGGEYIFFLNNDTVVLNNWLSSLIETFDKFETAGLVGSKLIYPNGLLQEAGGIIWNNGGCANYGRLDDPAAPQYNFERDADYISGAAIMVPASIWRELEGFSEEFAPAYYEDTDFAMKVREAGYRVIYQPRSVVVHFEGISSGIDTSSGVKRYQQINKVKFEEKWREQLQSHGDHGDFSREIVDRSPIGRILIFDADLPRPDKDSGSITAFFYNQLLVELGYRVTFVPENLVWAGKYVKDLQRVGVEVITTPYEFNARDYVLKNGDEFDLFILSRATTGGEFLKEVKSTFPEKPIVFDTVDIHHLRVERQFELTGDEELGAEAERLKKIEYSAIRSADATIVVSDHEVDYLQSELGAFPCAVLPLIYEPFERENGFEERKDIAFVGGYRHPPNVDAVEYLVNDVWPNFRNYETDAKLHIIGSYMPPEFKEFADDDIVIVGFVDDLEDYLSRMKMTVAPLRYGAGVKGKIGNSLRMGVPAVGTPIAGEGMGLEDDKNILVASGASIFAQKMHDLYTDADLWERLSVSGQSHVNDKFGLDAARATLDNLCRSLLRGDHA